MHAKRTRKRTILRNWTAEWPDTPQSDHLAAANRFAPSLKPTKHFTALSEDREVFGRLIQCRTGPGFFEEPQTGEHIIRHCPQCERQRGSLLAVSRDLVLSVQSVQPVGTKDSIRTLSQFWGKSGAFTKTGAAPWEDETLGIRTRSVMRTARDERRRGCGGSGSDTPSARANNTLHHLRSSRLPALPWTTTRFPMARPSEF